LCFSGEAKFESGNVISENPRVQWMKGKYGLMVHWLAPQPAKGPFISDFSKAVDAFDLKRFLNDFDQSGAEWIIFTIGQNLGTYASPNSVIDSLCGPGHTPKRDLVLEIAKAMKQRGKRFIAYLPCEVRGNETMKKGMGWLDQPNTDQALFQERYLKAIKEWSDRYGSNCDGWWLDGCYTWDAFPNKFMKWEEWYNALRSGNKDAAIAFNDGSYCIGITKPIVSDYDYLSGETEVLIDGKIRMGREPQSSLFMPEQAYVPGTHCLYHALVPIDVNWGHPNQWPAWANVPFKPVYPKKQDEMQLPVYSDNDLQKFVGDFTKVGGAVTLNVGIFQEGHFGKETVKQLQRLKKTIKSK